MRITILAMTILFCGPLLAYPVTVDSCDRRITFESAPEAVIANDGNMIEMMLVLGLEDRLVGISGMESLDEISAEMRPVAASLRLISRQYPTREVIIGHAPDLYFAGWNYGLKLGGDVTPAMLERFGISVYELTESCIHLGQAPDVSLDTMYVDLLNLGRIFGIEERAESLVSSYREMIEAIGADLPESTDWPDVFVYDSGEDIPFTAGRYAMPTALIEAAGGNNIANVLETSWATINWETVIEGNPDIIIIVNYGSVTAEQKRDFLRSHPALAYIKAVRNDRLVVLEYNEVTPGPRNINAVARLAREFHGIRPRQN